MKQNIPCLLENGYPAYTAWVNLCVIRSLVDLVKNVPIGVLKFKKTHKYFVLKYQSTQKQIYKTQYQFFTDFS